MYVVHGDDFNTLGSNELGFGYILLYMGSNRTDTQMRYVSESQITCYEQTPPVGKRLAKLYSKCSIKLDPIVHDNEEVATWRD